VEKRRSGEEEKWSSGEEEKRWLAVFVEAEKQGRTDNRRFWWIWESGLSKKRWRIRISC